jgi:steroid delta-isomerase-like uncharacterized protein
MPVAAPTLAEDNKAVIRRLFEEVWNKGNFALIDEIVAPNFTNHDPATPDFGRGPEAYQQLATCYRTAFPNLQFTLEEIVAEGDKVAVRYTSRGTHQSELSGIAATGKQVKVTGTFISRLADGKVEESWVNWDALGLLQQLGAVPAIG